MASLVGVSRLTDYTASKHGALGIDDSVRLELHAKRHNSYVKTTCVCPYLIKTGMFEGAKSAFPFSLLEPEAVADRIIYAVRQNEPLVVIPWRGNIIFLLKMLPIGVADTIAKWLGANSSMH
jgi:short-subunit dehydrogenase